MAAEPERSSMLEETTIVDTDVHRSISFEEVVGYLDEPHRSRIRSFIDTGYSPRPLSGWDQFMAGKIDKKQLKTADDLDVLREEFHVDYPIVNAISTLSAIPDTDLAVALMRAANDLLLTEFLDQHEEFLGVAIVAPQAPDKAAEEIDRLADEDQIVGTFISSTSPEKPLGHSKYDPLYRAAEDNGLHVAYHGAAASSFVTQFPIQNAGFERFLPVHVLTHTWSQMETFTSLLVNGTPEKFPDLNFILLEAGIGWVPYMTYRLNKEYSIRRSEAPLLEKSPEQYVRDQFYFGSQPLGEPETPSHMQQLIEMVGTDSIVFASDYPHWDFDHPSELEQYFRTHLSPDGREDVLFRSAVEAFDLAL